METEKERPDRLAESNHGKTAYFICGIIPLAIFILFWILKDARGPLWLTPFFDPDYAYLFNSLSLAIAKPVGHFDHPGTPLMAWGAFLLRILHPAANSTEMVTYVSHNPEYYLGLLLISVTGIIIILTYLIGFSCWRLTGNITLAMLVQSAMLCSTESFFALVRFKPEPFLLLTDLVILLLLIHALLRDNKKPKWQPLLLGIFLGIAFATKTTAISLLPLVFLFGVDWRKVLTTASASVVTLGLFLLPLHPHYLRPFSFAGKIASHQGQYGSGAAELPQIETYLANLIQAITGTPLPGFSLLLIIILLVSIKFKTSMAIPERYKRHAAIYAAFCILQWIMVAKHPGGRYLIPLIGMGGWGVLLLCKLLQLRFNMAKLRWFTRAFLFVSLTGCAWSFNSAYLHFKTSAQEKLAIRDKIADYTDKGYTLVTTYESSSQTGALNFANRYSRSRFSDLLIGIYPEACQMDFYAGGLVRFGKIMKAEDANRLSPFIISGIIDKDSMAEKFAPFRNGFDYTVMEQPKAVLVTTSGKE